MIAQRVVPFASHLGKEKAIAPISPLNWYSIS
jgi:hypothetical protein